MDKSTLIIAIALFVIGAGLAWYIKPPDRIYHTDEQQRQIDSLSVALVNTQASKESLRDSLEHTSKAFRDYIDEHEGEVASLTSIRGRLNTKIDELQDSLQRQQFDLSFLAMESQEPIDTTFTYSRTFGDDLFNITSFNHFTRDTFTDSLDVNQLRDIRLDIAILQSDDRRTVESIATSQDFDSLKVSAQTTIEPPKRKLHWSVLISLGILIREGLDAIF